MELQLIHRSTDKSVESFLKKSKKNIDTLMFYCRLQRQTERQIFDAHCDTFTDVDLLQLEKDRQFYFDCVQYLADELGIQIFYYSEDVLKCRMKSHNG